MGASELNEAELLPAWSISEPQALAPLEPIDWPEEITREWAWGGSRGRGARVCVIDSGVELDHPEVQPLAGVYTVEVDESGLAETRLDEEGDVSGHGTACAGIIRALAPECELTSMRVLTRGTEGSRGMGIDLLGGLAWAIEQRFDVVNISLATKRRRYAEALHELADDAYYAGVTIVASANNMPVEGYPWRFSSVLSVGSHEAADPLTFFWNSEPPVEVFARGVDVEAAWIGGTRSRLTGNSFAAPHISAIAALILSKHPGMRTPELKSVLRATAGEPTGGAPA